MPSGGADHHAKVGSSPRRKIDLVLVAATSILVLIGLISLYSIDKGGSSKYFFHQVVRIAIGLVPFLIFLLIDPRSLMRRHFGIYAAMIGLLVVVLLKGSTRGGAERWIDLGPLDFQPSELAKIFIAITLSAFFVRRLDRVAEPSTFALSLLHIIVPMALIMKQPHLGATLTIFVTWVAISLVAGVPVKYLIATFLALCGGFVVALKVPGILSDYHRERVQTFLFGGSESDEFYQQSRALSAIASGGVTGKGLLKGEFKGTKFVPQQQTDYICTVIGEEGGLAGCACMLAAFGFFFYRVWLIMFRTQEPFYRLVTAGIFAYLAFHMVANLGMCLTLLPVVGLWLPFLSYGGTAMWLCLASVGLLLNFKSREKPVLF